MILKSSFPSLVELKFCVSNILMRINHCLAVLFPLVASAQEPNIGSLTLVEEAGFNQFDITVGASGASDRDRTSLTGTAEVALNIDPTSGTTDSLVITGADISATDMNFTLRAFFIITVASLNAENLKGTADTPLGFGPVNRETGKFDAALHTFTLNEGTISGEALDNPVNSDVSESPITGNGTGEGTVALTNPVEGPDRKVFYDVTVTLPISIDDTIPVEEGGIEASVEVSGTLKAVGTAFIIRPPTYDEWAAELGLAENQQDGFDLNPRIPNDVLFALGHDNPTVSTELFQMTAEGLRLNVAESGMRSNVVFEYSSDCDNWGPLPAGHLLTSPSEVPILSTPNGVGFYRVSSDQ